MIDSDLTLPAAAGVHAAGHDRRTSMPAGDSLTLPRRLDVHRIDEIVSRLGADGGRRRTVSVDGRQVEMIDLTALRALESLAAARELRIHDASVALTMTAELTGHARLADACRTTPLQLAA